MDEKIRVIYEDKNFLAVSKPAGLLVHQANIKYQKSPPGADPPRAEKIKNEPTLIDWLLKNYPEIKNVGDPSISSGQVNPLRPGIVHRLDKDTSGVILIPKNQEYFNYLKKLFQNHQIEKKYLALVWGKFSEKKGEINKPISLKSGTTKRTIFRGKMEKEAITGYKVLKTLKLGSDYFSLLSVYPKTGRTHQIRIHLASVNHPVVGDQLYGRRINLFGLNRQFLHAESLEWSTKEGKRIKIECGLPEDLEKILDSLQPAE